MHEKSCVGPACEGDEPSRCVNKPEQHVHDALRSLAAELGKFVGAHLAESESRLAGVSENEKPANRKRTMPR